MLEFLRGGLGEGGLLAGAQRRQGHGGDGVGSQLAQGALLTGGPRAGGDGVQGGVQQQGVHGRQHKPDLAEALARRPGARHAPPGDIGLGSLIVPIGVDLHEGPIQVPTHLRHGASGCLGQHLLLDLQRHRDGNILQTASHQGRLRRVQDPGALHGLNRAEASVHEGVAVIHHLAGSSPGDPQAGGEQAGGVESALLVADHG